MTRVREARLERNLTQAELALAAGISRPLLSLVENGYVSQRSDALERIATALDIPLALLVPEGALVAH